jgi:hypothetical protein
MRFLLFSVATAVATVSSLGCTGDQKLVQAPDPRCGQPCYGGPSSVGACQLGSWTCDSQEQVIACVGWVAGPDCADGGLPNACDQAPGACLCTAGGTRACYDGPAGTEGVGICHAGSQTCTAEGSWGPCVGEQTPQPETCNCQDDDCNGLVDDIPPDQFCYDGPPATAGVGICHPGVRACSGEPGCSEYCAGEQLPQSGPCAGFDAACTGASQSAIDFVFLLDDTDLTCADGMGVSELIQAQQTLATFAFENPQASFRYGLIVMPGCGGTWLPGPTDGGFTLAGPLADEQAFLPLAAVQCAVDAAEDPPCATTPFYSYDVLYQQATGGIIPWDATAQQRYVVLFTGAKGGSRTSVTAGMIQQAFVQNGVTPIIFAGNGHRADYDPCVANTSGADFNLADLPHMLAEMQLSLTPVCGSTAGDGGI